MNSFTIGPWIADGSRVISEGQRSLMIARVGVAPDGDYSPANARLIAAAPDMYEALKKAKALIADMSRHVSNFSLNDYSLFNAAPIEIDAALAKADGAQ